MPTIHRFYIKNPQIKDDIITISSDISWQIVKVLRLKKGEKIIVFDGSKKELLITLNDLKPYVAMGKIEKEMLKNTEPSLKIVLYQSLLPRAKIEEILDIGCQVGISEFVLMESDRSLLRKKDLKEGHINRFRKIIIEASEQSARVVLPQVGKIATFKDALLEALKDGPVLVAWENEQQTSLSTVLNTVKNAGKISVFIGPEGGFTQEEIEFAQKNNALTVSLGPRVLRSETAGLVFSIVLLYAAGDFEKNRVQIT